MRIAIFCHSVVSDWNNGNAHFLRGVARDLVARGHEVRVFEPADGWSRRNLVARYGTVPRDEFRKVFPELTSTLYDLDTLDLEEALDGVDLALVHEWNDARLVRRIGLRRSRAALPRVLFHDTHHRSLTKPHELERLQLGHYDGVLAYGEVIRRIYVERGWARCAWTWHEAADVRLFRPLLVTERAPEIVWIGNWGDGERTRELREFLLEPVRRLGLRGSVFGVRYPASGRHAVASAGLAYGGWLPNHRVPEVFARHAVTVHVPRRPYIDTLPGIPTIRPFEALACGIPLVCSPWEDVEGLFTPGEDFLVARNGDEMRSQLARVLRDRELAWHLAQHGRQTIFARHTCAHRVEELLGIARELGLLADQPLATEAAS